MRKVDHSAPRGAAGVSAWRHHVELDSIDERVLVDRLSVCCTLAQRLAVKLAGSSHVLGGDRRERDTLDRIDLDLTRTDAVAAALLDAWLLPQSDGEGDVSGQDVVAQLAAELHAPDASYVAGALAAAG